MGNWNINIQGLGCHHNQDNPTDANLMARKFVCALQNAGHTVEGATFTCGSKETLLTSPTSTSVEQEAARLYTAYCSEVGGKAFNGDPLPGWSEFSNDQKKQIQANAWREVGRLSLTH